MDSVDEKIKGSRHYIEAKKSPGYKKDIAIAKAIGIILMVIGHSGCPTYVWDFIYMFHKVPLFFFLAGYCFKEKYLLKPKEFILRRFSKLYVPFVVITLIFLFLHNLFIKLNLVEGSLYSWQDFLYHSKSIILHLHIADPLIGGFWFIPQLLLASLISFIFLKFCNKYVALILCIFFAILKYYVHLHIPYISWVNFYASSFFIIGNIVADNNKITNNFGGLFVSMGIVMIALRLLPDGIFVSQGWMILPYLFVAVSGCILTLNISNLILRTKNVIVNILVYIGSKTIWILALHIMAFKLLTLLIIYIKGDPIANLRITPIYNMGVSGYSCDGVWIIYSILGVVIPIGVSLVVKSVKGWWHERNKCKSIKSI